jgi:hypothetical protein
MVKLVAWTAWAQHLAEIDAEPGVDEQRALQFHPDALHVGDWQTIREVDADPHAPDGRPWEDETILVKLVAWAECGYFLLGGRPAN